jgi:hypothetical protein
MKREATIEGWSLVFDNHGEFAVGDEPVIDAKSPSERVTCTFEYDSLEVSIRLDDRVACTAIPLAVLEQLIAWHKEPPK